MGRVKVDKSHYYAVTIFQLKINTGIVILVANIFSGKPISVKYNPAAP